MKKQIKLSTALMLMLLTVVSTFNITFFVAGELYNDRLGNLSQTEDRYSKLKELAEIVETYFVGEYDESAAIEGALAGYIAGLGDRWSGYYTVDETLAQKKEDATSYVGVGLTYSGASDNPYTIVSVTNGGPAATAGIRPGDVIVAVDGRLVSELGENESLNSVVGGEEGSEVTITVTRGLETLTFTMKRAKVMKESVYTEMLEHNIGYVYIDGFDQNAGTEFKTKVNTLVADGAKALVFDVRFNPGGYLTVMRDMLDLLLPSGTVISTVDKTGQTTEYSSDANCLDLPMAVVVNQHSYSAAEFFAAALQEYRKAEVVGIATTGKGYSQQRITLSDGSSVNLSTARYYTPLGKNLAGVGVMPDYPVVVPEEEANQYYYQTKVIDSSLRQAMNVMMQKLGIPLPQPDTEGSGSTAPVTDPEA